MTQQIAKRLLLAALLLLVAPILIACGGRSSEVFSDINYGLDEGSPLPPAPGAASEVGGLALASVAEREAVEGGAVAQAPGGQGGDAVARLIIKTASISVQVEDVNVAEAAINRQASALGGFVVSTESFGSGEDRSVYITFRVPVERFDQALTEVEGLAARVLSRSVSGQDVTEEFVDLESRLTNLEASRDRMRELLLRAEDVEDALVVNQALTEIQGEIEMIQGRMRYLSQSASLSTVSVQLDPVPPPTAIVAEEGWQPFETARIALRDLLEFGQGLADIAITFAIWLPVWLPLVLLFRWLWVRFILKQRPAPPAPPAPQG